MVTVYVLSGGYLELGLTLFLPDAKPAERWTIPVPCYLVSHPRGFLLFDTGVHRQAITDPVGRLGERRAQLFGVRSGPGDHVVGQLEMLGLRPVEIGLVANSHFHFDHCGGAEFFPDATVLVQRRELAAARHPEAIPPLGCYTPRARDFNRPLEYQEVDGEHDVFGDGRVVLFPTYGHTPGHQSLRVRLGKQRDLVFTADACYTKINMDRDLLPGVVWDSTEMTRSLTILRALRDRHGATLVYGHDPAQWRGLARAPVPLDAGG